jgi:hypothetical protein
VLKKNRKTQKPIILFDIDNTLFMTRKFLNETPITISKKFKLNQKEIIEIAGRYENSLPKPTDFTYFRLIDIIAEKYQLEKLRLEHTVFDYIHFDKFLFNDVLPSLKELSKKYVLGIFSEGDIKYQTEKLVFMQIEKYINKDLVYIYKNKRIEEILNNLPDSTIIDDNPEIIGLLQEQKHIKPILINRNKKEARVNTNTIMSLSQLY